MKSPANYDPLPDTKKHKPFDILGFVIRYGLMIIVFGLFIMTMLIPVVLQLKKPDYEVSAIMKVDPVIPSLITKSEQPSITGFYHDFVRTQAKRIADDANMKKALEKLGEDQQIKMLAETLSTKEKIAILQALVKVNPVSRTHLISLSIRGPKKEGLAPLLNALMEGYLENMASEQQQKDGRRITYLKEKKQLLRESIALKENQIQELTKEVLSSTFVEDFNIWQKRVVRLQSAYISVLSKRVEAEKNYQFSLDTAAKVRKLPLDSLIEESVMADDAIDFTSSWTYQKLQEMRGSIDGITAQNDDRRRIEQRMQAMREYEAKLRRETRETVAEIVHGKQELELNRSLIEKENRLKEILASEKELFKELSNAKEISGIKSTLLLKAKGYETELTHDRSLLFRIDTRIHELEAESRAPLRVNIETFAKDPDKPAGSNIKKLLMACVVLSFGSTGALFLLIEFIDNRIRSPKNIFQALGHPPSWPISKCPGDVPFDSVLSRAPDSPAAKALRSLATRLYRENEERGSQIFLFSGVENGCGTSSITRNIGRALSRLAGKALILDVTKRSSVKVGSIETAQEIAPGLDFLPLSFKDDSARSRVYAVNMAIEQHKTSYDYILIDSSPILQSDLTESLAAKSDAVMLIAQGDSTTYARLRHSAEILLRMEIPALAPVLNWGGVKEETRLDMYLNRIARFISVKPAQRQEKAHA